MGIRAYTIGRRPDNDIVLMDETVSRVHAEILLLERGRTYLTDCQSSYGTRVFRQGEWEEVRQAFVAESDLLRFGDYEIGARSLVAKIQSPENASPQSSTSDVQQDAQVEIPDSRPEGVKVRRDPETGEIIPDQQ